MSQSSFVCTQLNGLYYSKGLDISIWPINWTLTGSTTLGLSGPGSNGNERVHQIPQYSKIGVSSSGGLNAYPGPSLGWRGLSLCRDAFGVFYSLQQLTELSKTCFVFLE